ncbi:MAG: minor capsid protein [Oscillospiraceae bacterium]|nr:minor capsid protein [Oscillospiraceae bacterium]
MYIRKTGYVVGTQNKKADSSRPYRIYQIGRVLTLKEEKRLRKSADLEAIKRNGYRYYWIIAEKDERLCDICRENDGAVYPVSEAEEGVNLPPFHPNCRCYIMAYDLSNPHDDPGRAEILFWLEIMYGGLSIEEQIQAYLDFYGDSELSEAFIMSVLLSTQDIKNINERIEVFFSRLKSKNGLPANISSDGIEFLKQIEGFSPDVYLDSAGNPTIAFGHLIQEGEDFSGGITIEDATILFYNDNYFFMSSHPVL